MPVTASAVVDKGTARAWTRGSPNRKAGALLPSSVRVGRAIRSKAGLARTQPWPTRSVSSRVVFDGPGTGLQFIEMDQPPQTAQIVRVVDHGLDPQRAP